MINSNNNINTREINNKYKRTNLILRNNLFPLITYLIRLDTSSVSLETRLPICLKSGVEVILWRNNPRSTELRR